MSEEPAEKIVYVAQLRHGFGILDWISDSFLWRLLRVLGPLALVAGAYGFMLELGDRRATRDAEAWQTLETKAEGNSGKIEALEYLNSDTAIRISNPRTWKLPFGLTIPVGPKRIEDCGGDDPIPFLGPRNALFAVYDVPPDEWVLVCDFGPFKSQTRLVGINLSGAPSEDGTKWTGQAYLVGVKLDDAALEGAQLAGADLELAHLRHANLGCVQFLKVGEGCARLDGADMMFAHLEQARLGDASLLGTNLRYAFLDGADLSYAHMDSAILDTARLRGADIAFASLVRANLADAMLDGADLAVANLQDADLYRASLGNADLEGANLDGANLIHADLRKVRHLTQQQIDSACTGTGTRLPPGLSPTRPPCTRDALESILRGEDGRPLRDAPDPQK